MCENKRMDAKPVRECCIDRVYEPIPDAVRPSQVIAAVQALGLNPDTIVNVDGLRISRDHIDFCQFPTPRTIHDVDADTGNGPLCKRAVRIPVEVEA